MPWCMSGYHDLRHAASCVVRRKGKNPTRPTESHQSNPTRPTESHPPSHPPDRESPARHQSHPPGIASSTPASGTPLSAKISATICGSTLRGSTITWRSNNSSFPFGSATPAACVSKAWR